MHIPDGLLDAKTWAGAAVLAAGGVSYAAGRVRRSLDSRQVPRIAVLTAFIFAAQMLNFPIAGGTSGHLLGGALAAITFGPWTATVVMTTVVAIQALVFQDGGITALGANVLNMALAGPLAAYIPHRLLRSVFRSQAGWIASVFVAGLVSTLATALLCALELALSGVIPLRVGLPVVGFGHLLMGVVEGTITAAVAVYLQANRPELLQEAKRRA